MAIRVHRSIATVDRFVGCDSVSEQRKKKKFQAWKGRESSVPLSRTSLRKGACTIYKILTFEGMRPMRIALELIFRGGNYAKKLN